MKKILTSLFLTSSLLFANNEIYLDQSGNTGTFTIVQYGSQNKIGSASKRSELTGESKLYDLVSQVIVTPTTLLTRVTVITSTSS